MKKYSDKELKEFETLLQEKLAGALKEMKYFETELNRSQSNDTEDTGSKFINTEDAESFAAREQMSQMATRQQQYIKHLKDALKRIENKSYGICRETGKLISKERLRAVPHATLSIGAKKGSK